MAPVNPSEASTFRRMASGLLLLIGPAMILVASIVDPTAGEDGGSEGYLTALRDDPDMAQLATALWIWGFVLTAIGLVGLVHVIRERGVALANIGGALAIVGMIMFIVLFAGTIHDLNNVEHLGVGTAERLGDDLGDDYWMPDVVRFPAIVGTLAGFVLLAAAIVRSRVIHPVAAVPIVLWVVAIAAGAGSSKAVAIAANVLLLAGWGLAGLKILGMKDEQWDGRV